MSVETLHIHPAALLDLPASVWIGGKRIGSGWVSDVDLSPAENLVRVEISYGDRGPIELELGPEAFADASLEPPVITIRATNGLQIVAHLVPLAEGER
jgi:hypothetical protein